MVASRSPKRAFLTACVALATALGLGCGTPLYTQLGLERDAALDTPEGLNRILDAIRAKGLDCNPDNWRRVLEVLATAGPRVQEIIPVVKSNPCLTTLLSHERAWQYSSEMGGKEDAIGPNLCSFYVAVEAKKEAAECYASLLQKAQDCSGSLSTTRCAGWFLPAVSRLVSLHADDDITLMTLKSLSEMKDSDYEALAASARAAYDTLAPAAMKYSPAPPVNDNPPPPAPSTGARVATSSRFIVAVFDIQDSSQQFNKGTLDPLTDYLCTRVSQEAGYRVVPRQQLRERLMEEKKESYKVCYDEACQIELGKAISAQKSLATKIMRIGGKCAITASLYDLKTETTEKSASERTNCSEGDLMDGMDSIAKQLAKD